MSGFGTLGRIRTRKHIRTRRSIPISTGRGRMTWSRVKEREELARENERLEARRREYVRQRRCLER